jgi:hypothetical protein
VSGYFQQHYSSDRDHSCGYLIFLLSGVICRTGHPRLRFCQRHRTPLPTNKAITPVPTVMRSFMGKILWGADLIYRKYNNSRQAIILAMAIILMGRKQYRDRFMLLFSYYFHRLFLTRIAKE